MKSNAPFTKKGKEAALEEIIQRLSEGETLTAICRADHLPKPRTVYEWADEDKELGARIARAKQEGCDAIADQCFAIANAPGETTVTTIHPDGGVTVQKSDNVAHRKLQIYTRMQLLAKWAPKKYGEKVTQEIEAPSGPVIVTLPPDAKL